MAREQHPGLTPEMRACQDGVAIADNLQPRRLRPQRGLDLVGDAALRPRLAGDVDQRRGQLDRVAVEIKHAVTIAAGQRQKRACEAKYGGVYVCSARRK